jgi:hypothetical protein
VSPEDLSELKALRVEVRDMIEDEKFSFTVNPENGHKLLDRMFKVLERIDGLLELPIAIEYLEQSGRFEFVCIGHHIHQSQEDLKGCETRMVARLFPKLMRGEKLRVPMEEEGKRHK